MWPKKRREQQWGHFAVQLELVPTIVDRSVSRRTAATIVSARSASVTISFNTSLERPATAGPVVNRHLLLDETPKLELSQPLLHSVIGPAVDWRHKVNDAHGKKGYVENMAKDYRQKVRRGRWRLLCRRSKLGWDGVRTCVRELL
jgi:hypothetical protein